MPLPIAGKIDRLAALQRDALRKADDYQKEGQKEAEKTDPAGPENFLSVADQNRGDDTENASNDQKAAHKRRFNWKLDAVAAFTGLLTFVTGIQVWAFLQSERAEIVLVGSPRAVISTPDQFTITISFKNDGRSPGIIETSSINAITLGLQQPAPEKPKYRSEDVLLRGVVGAGEPIQTLFSLFSDAAPIIPNGSVTLASTELKEVIDGHRKILIYGFIDFSDGYSLFGSRRHGFCFQYAQIAGISVVWTKEHYDLVRQNKAQVLLTGRITYTDIFDVEHTTDFSRRFGSENDGPDVEVTAKGTIGGFRECETGNDYT